MPDPHATTDRAAKPNPPGCPFCGHPFAYRESAEALTFRCTECYKVYTQQLFVEINRRRAQVRPHLWLRLRYAWQRLRLGKQGRRMADAVNEQIEREFLGL